jgi:hypothetical protein
MTANTDNTKKKMLNACYICHDKREENLINELT